MSKSWEETTREERDQFREKVSIDWLSRPLTDDQVWKAPRWGTWTICETCGFPYVMHPMEDRAKALSGIDGLPYLNRMCDGITLAKL